METCADGSCDDMKKIQFIMHFEITSAINHIHQRYTCHSVERWKIWIRKKCRINSYQNWYDTLQQIRNDIHIIFCFLRFFFISITFWLVFSFGLANFSKKKFRFSTKRFRIHFGAMDLYVIFVHFMYLFGTNFCPFLLINGEMNNEFCVLRTEKTILGMEFQSKIPFSNRNGFTVFGISHIIFNYYSFSIINCHCIFIIQWKYFVLELSIPNNLILCPVHCTLYVHVSIHEQSAINEFHLHISIKL